MNPNPSPQPPQPFGKYQLLKKLATGGMAEVWLARQSGIEGFAKNVVVKRILPHLAEDREFVEMFRNEALIAANFNHPNIAQVYEFGEAHGTYYIAMEYIHGEDLGRVMRKAWTAGQWIARPLAIRIVASACEGLYYAHTRMDSNGKPLKVVHRDISPQNILISFDGSVKLVDFGIAKAADTVGLTKSGAIKGKFAYMPPEQAGGKPLDHRADIFAIGLVLYELLTGVRPLKRDSELATLQAALECSIQTPSEVTDVPAELDSVVMNALAKAADARYRDARQFQVALEETLVAQRWVASSVQISELMETLFADRLEEEKKTGNLQPSLDDAASADSDAGGGRGPSPAVDMSWEAPPGEISQRNERRASGGQRAAGTRQREAVSAQRSLAEEMAEYSAPPGGGTQVARRRTGEAPRRTTNPGQPSTGRADSVPEMEAPDTLPPPRRSSMRPLEVEEESQEQQEEQEDDLPSRTRARAALRTGSPLAVKARARHEEDPYADPERTRLPPSADDLDSEPEPEPKRRYEPEPEPEPETLPPPRRRTGRASRVSPATGGSSSAVPRRRTSNRVDIKEAPPPRRTRDEEEREDERENESENESDSLERRRPEQEPRVRVPLSRGETVKKVVLGLMAVGVAILFVVLGPKLMKRPLDGMGIFVTVDTNPRVMVKVKHGDRCGSPEPFTELGMTPIKGAPGAHIQDTLILENVEQGIYAEEEESLRFGEPGETKSIKREFKMGHVRLKVTPRNVGQLTILKKGQELGLYLPGAKLELMEGLHTLELRGDQLKEPVEVEVNIKARDTTETQVDLTRHMVK